MGKLQHCPEWEEKLSLYVDGVLNPFDENAVTAHLAHCAGCRATVELWQAVGQSVRRLPRELPPPDLRARILASTTRRRRLPRRMFVGWRVFAPALGVGLLLGWITLPRHEPSTAPLTRAPAPRVEATLPTPPRSKPRAAAPSAPLVMVLQSAPAYRTASPAPRWLAQTRLSPATTVPNPTPTIVTIADSTPRFTPTTPNTPAIVTEIAESSDLTPAFNETPTTNTPSRPASVTAAQDLTDMMKQLSQQLREGERRRNADSTSREPDRRRFFVPIVTVDLR
ncbi:MAG: zf-HC2 domain-containing protein [Fimbriimonadales bacterium]|nr:zf-HC2 domain-containing protein [Fimbriimonadales bacterium]